MRALVVVPTLAAHPLKPLLDAVATQCRAVADHECAALVLHNGPASRELADLAAAAGVSYEHHEPLGYSAIRNEALRRAVAGGFDVLAMIDDDELPDTGWLAALFAPFAFGADVVVGPVRTVWPAGAPARFARSALPRAMPERPDGFVDTDLRSGNCAIRVGALGSLRFDERFNNVGGEDTALFRAVRAAGGRCYWAGSAGVTELVDVDRVSLGYFARRSFAQGRTLAAVRVLMPRDDDPPRSRVVRARAARALRLVAWAATRHRMAHILEGACEVAFIGGFVSARVSRP